MITETIGSATISVDAIGNEWQPYDRGYRQRYAYSIVTPDWRYDGDDIRSGVGAAVDENDALRTLASFLGACAEARRYSRYGENADLFPEHVGAWAEENEDDLSTLSIDPSEYEGENA